MCIWWNNEMNSRILAVLVVMMLAGVLSDISNAAMQTITIDAAKTGRTFEGIGGLSAGASSRFLIDYSEPYRSQILDYLFRPNFGASLHHLKVEIPGSMNSTDGTEPSHANTRKEFENPCGRTFSRGYEWWLMKEAKKRNAAIMFDCLEWGVPAWIGNGKFFSQDNIDYIIRFIKGVDFFHNIKFDYVGIWNESTYDVNYVILLRKTLDEQNLRHIKIVAADDMRRNPKAWRVADDIIKDSNFAAAVYAIGVHYPGAVRKGAPVEQFESPVRAKSLGKPLWSSEEGAWRNDWKGAELLAKAYNRNYIKGKFTKAVVWALVTSYYDNLPCENSGLMQAITPWSGYYEVCPPVWITAHTTQFAQPGWVYLDGGCGLLNDGGSFVTLKSSSESGDYSIIIETMDSAKPQTIEFRITDGLSGKPLHVWATNRNEQFIQRESIKPIDGIFSITCDPCSVYSLTTTTGQKKGIGRIAADVNFPFPYSDNFEKYDIGTLPAYFCDQAGIFEVEKRTDGLGKCIRQIILEKGIEWGGHKQFEPYTIIGSTKWKDYKISCDLYIEKCGHVSICGRIGKISMKPVPPNGYWFKISANGTWEIYAFTDVIASGKADIKADNWYKASLAFNGNKITADIDGHEVCSIMHKKFESGNAGIGSGWNSVFFDNFKIESQR